MKPLAAAVLLSLAACFPKSTSEAPTLTAAQISGTHAAGATPETLAHGRATFVAKCNNCHGYPDVNAIAENEWPGIINEMGHKAKLSPDEMNDTLRRFVLAAGGH